MRGAKQTRTTPEQRVLSVAQVAAMCHVAPETIRRWSRRFGLTAYNTSGGLAIKILESDLRAFSEKNRVYVDWAVAEDDD